MTAFKPFIMSTRSLARRGFITFRQTSTSNLKKQYAERRVLGYSSEQMYGVVADIDEYRHFVPWCRNSTVTTNSPTQCTADMVIGFPPLLTEKYTAHVVLQRPHLIRSECVNGKLFDELITIWKFSQGLPHQPNTCTLDFVVSFQFRSVLHSHMASLFFDEVVRTMVNAFLRRVKSLHGPSSITPRKPQILRYRS